MLSNIKEDQDNTKNIIDEEISIKSAHDDQIDNKKENQNNKTSRYKDGELLKFIRIRFPGNAKSFQFLIGDRNFLYGQKVVAMSDRGTDVGYINSFPYQLKFNKNMLPLKSINREANQEDIDQQLKNIQQEKNAEVYCNNLIKTMKLNMNITHVQMLQFGKKMVFYFTAPSRVDFRDLVKDLVGKLKMRIELRQISIRDRAACVGAVGSCGQITCCSSFLKSYGAVNIKMAKNQNLALIPSKLNGVCGQIKCCIKFENEVYTFKREKLPREGQLIQTRNGDKGKVQNLSVLNETFVMKTDKGQLRRYLSNQFDKNINLPKDWKYPTEFSSFINELHLTIGNLNDIPEVATSSQVETSSQTKSETETEVVQKLNENSSSKSREKSQQTQQPQQHKKKKSYRNNRNRNKNNQKNTSKQ